MRSLGRGLRQTVLAACALAGMLVPAIAAGPVSVEPVEISARPISQFRIGHDDKQFGPLEFVGGLEMTSPSRDFGALSAFRFLKPGGDFIGVADTGFWFFGTVAHLSLIHI